MYSYEQRLRAVELYIQLGKRVGATIRQLGYPTKNALKSWYREYQRQLDLPRGYVRSKRKYSQEQKEAAVRHYLDHGRCMAFTMKTLGYPRRQSLAAWIGELHSEARVLVVSKSEQPPRSPELKQSAVIALLAEPRILLRLFFSTNPYHFASNTCTPTAHQTSNPLGLRSAFLQGTPGQNRGVFW